MKHPNGTLTKRSGRKGDLKINKRAGRRERGSLTVEDDLIKASEESKGSFVVDLYKKLILVFLLGAFAGFVIGAICEAQASEFTEMEEPLLVTENPGTLPEDTHACSATVIDTGSISLLNKWTYLIEKLLANQDGGPDLTPGEHELGFAITSMGICGTFAEDYRVGIVTSTEDHILFRFDASLGFGPETLIARSESFIPDE